MAKLVWDTTGERFYETGVRQCALYLQDESGAYPQGVVWNGITSITESPSGADAEPLYADDIKYLELRAKEEFGGTIEAYTYPKEFEQCDGSAELADIPGVIIGQQNRATFGLCYRTVLGNDVKKDDYGYKIHIIYGCTASPSDKEHQSTNESPEAITFSWEFTTTPVNVANAMPTSTITIDSTKLSAAQLAAVEKALYGDGSSEAYLPLPDDLAALIKAAN